MFADRDLKVPVTETITYTAEVLHRGRTLGVAQVTARGASGKTCAIATITAPLGGEMWTGSWEPWPGPAGTFFALLLHGQAPQALVSVARAAFWTHEAVLFLFLNLLPHSKHFHIITAIPNVFLRSLQPAGRLEPTRLLAATAAFSRACSWHWSRCSTGWSTASSRVLGFSERSLRVRSCLVNVPLIPLIRG